jgi:hypothetical protein
MKVLHVAATVLVPALFGLAVARLSRLVSSRQSASRDGHRRPPPIDYYI